MIGTVYHNSSSSTNNNYLSFQIFTRRSCEPQVQERACPTRTYACLAKHYSKQPIGAPRLNLVPASPKLYKVVFHNVLVGIPTLMVHTYRVSQPTQLTQHTQLTQLFSRIKGSQTYCNRFGTINLISSKCYLLVFIIIID